MRKLKIYLDTTVISHLDHRDTPDKMADTWLLWELIQQGKYEAVISETTLDELGDCPEEKFALLTEYLHSIPYRVVADSPTIVEVAEKFIGFGILRQKSFDDCRHIAAAIVSGCDAIVSWNFKHIVNPKTAVGVKAVTATGGYPDLMIYTPTFLIGGDTDDS